MTGARPGLRQIGVEALLVAAGLIGAAWCAQALPLAPVERAAAWAASAGGPRLTGELWPARLGLNRLSLIVLDPAGVPIRDAEIEVTFLPVGGGGVVTRRPLAAADGRYSASGFALSRPGPWQMLVAVRAPGQSPAYASVDWLVGPEGGVWLTAEARPLGAQILGWVNQAGAASLGGLAALGLLGWGWRTWRRLRQMN